MSAAERRAANRARVAQGFGDLDPPPGLTGPEISHIRAITAAVGEVSRPHPQAHPWRRRWKKP